MKVTLADVTKRFGDFTAVAGFNAELDDGKLFCLLGPSGCGKSTLLNMISGIEPVTEGSIYFDERDVTKLPPDERGIGFVFQNYALYPHMTVLGNICFPLEIQRVKKAERVQRAMEIAKLVHVDQLIKRYPKELSGGQQQRVAIARALIKNPSLLLLDEPLSNLDARLRIEMREEIRRIQQETGVTTVFVTHDQEEAMSISDRILLMSAGVLQQNDDPQRLYTEPVNKFVADFLGNPKINSIEGRLSADGGTFITGRQGIKIQLPSVTGRTAPQAADKKLVLAVRPESFSPAGDSENSFTARIERIAEMGRERIATVNVDGCALHAFLPDDLELHEGDSLELMLKNRGVFLFDAETGDRLW